MNAMTVTPFGPAAQKVSLTRAPLVNVIAQVRFPAVMKIEADSGFVATFQESIRKDYPILRLERQLGGHDRTRRGPTAGRRDGLALRDEGS